MAVARPWEERPHAQQKACPTPQAYAWVLTCCLWSPLWAFGGPRGLSDRAPLFGPKSLGLKPTSEPDVA
jgi:hypothetical protein